MIAKHVAARDKDRRFFRSALRHGLAQPDVLRARLAATELDPAQRELLEQRLAAELQAAH